MALWRPFGLPLLDHVGRDVQRTQPGDVVGDVISLVLADRNAAAAGITKSSPKREFFSRLLKPRALQHSHYGHSGHLDFRSFAYHSVATSRAKMAAPIRADLRMSRLERPKT
jgi:hypothetical protein